MNPELQILQRSVFHSPLLPRSTPPAPFHQRHDSQAPTSLVDDPALLDVQPRTLDRTTHLPLSPAVLSPPGLTPTISSLPILQVASPMLLPEPHPRPLSPSQPPDLHFLPLLCRLRYLSRVPSTSDGRVWRGGMAYSLLGRSLGHQHRPGQ